MMIAPRGLNAKPFAAMIAVVLGLFLLPGPAQAEQNWTKSVLEAWIHTDHESDPDKREEVLAAANALRNQALEGDVAAQVLLARVYETGLPREGVSRQKYPHRALGWYMKAAVAGDGFARTRLKTLLGKLPYFIEMASPPEPPLQSDDSADRIEKRLQ